MAFMVRGRKGYGSEGLLGCWPWPVKYQLSLLALSEYSSETFRGTLFESTPISEVEFSQLAGEVVRTQMEDTSTMPPKVIIDLNLKLIGREAYEIGRAHV